MVGHPTRSYPAPSGPSRIEPRRHSALSVGERNLLGRGQYVRASVQYGQRARGFEVGFVEPYFLGYRMALGLDVFAKETNNSDYSSYNTRNIGGAVRLGFQLREDLTFQVRYSLYQQEITLDDDLSSCFTNVPQTQTQINNCAAAGTLVPSLPVRLTLLDGATLTSMALQYGVPLEVLVNKFAHVRFEPSGFTKNPEIPMAKSLTDYIFRFLGARYLSAEQRVEVGLADYVTAEARVEREPQEVATAPRASVVSFSPQADAPSCSDCGAIMVRNGSCYKCLNCGSTSGCS